MIPCDAIIDAERLDTLRSETSSTRAKSYEKLKKNPFQQKGNLQNKKIICFASLFINYHIVSC